MDSGVNITLENIIQRKILWCQNDTNKELFDINLGYIRGFKQMLMDMEFSESEFLAKYLGIVESLKTIFDSPHDSLCENIDELSGYNNAMVEILSLLDEKYLYDKY